MYIYMYLYTYLYIYNRLTLALQLTHKGEMQCLLSPHAGNFVA